MSRYILSPEARDDLDEIIDYIARDSLQAALHGATDVKSILARGFG